MDRACQRCQVRFRSAAGTFLIQCADVSPLDTATFPFWLNQVLLHAHALGAETTGPRLQNRGARFGVSAKRGSAQRVGQRKVWVSAKCGALGFGVSAPER